MDPARTTPGQPSDRPVFRPGLHRYCLALAGATLLLIAAGGQVKSHEAGLSVPDWPTSFGYNMFLFPPNRWVGGILYEHTHRLIASLVGLMTIGQVIWLFRVEPRRWLRRLGVVALGAVIAQGVLGGLTVKFGLPAPVSVAHGCLAQSFLCINILIALATSRGWLTRSAPAADDAAPRLRQLAPLCTATIFVQLLLGACMRHTESGLAVPDFPLAYGRLWPALDDASVAACNAQRAALGLPAVSATQIRWHMLHRAAALAVAGVVLLTAARARRVGRVDPRLAAAAAWLVVLLLMQLFLGAGTVLSGRAPLVATLHVACGAALLGTSFALSAWAIRTLRPAAPGAGAALAPLAAAGRS